MKNVWKNKHIEMGYVTIVTWSNRVTARALAFRHT